MFLTLFAVGVSFSTIQPYTYPLDPLSASEQQAATNAVKADFASDPNADYFLFETCELIEPTKEAMLQYKQNPIDSLKPPRKAVVNIWNSVTDEYWSYVCDLEISQVEFKQPVNVKKKFSVQAEALKRAIPGARPHLTLTEIDRAEIALLGSGPRSGSSAFYAAMQARGLTDTAIQTKISFDMALDSTSSLFDQPNHKARVLRITPYYDDAGPNPYSFSCYNQPIDEVMIYMDLNQTPPAIQVVDSGIPGQYRPINKESSCTNLAKPHEPANYCCFNRGTRNTLNRLKVSINPSFQIDGYKVSWDNWSFRYAPHPRLGLVLYDITYKDRHQSCTETTKRFCKGTQKLVEKERPILYRASCDAVVSIDGEQNSATLTMQGDYPPAFFASPLVRGLDVPPHATLLPAIFTNENGSQTVLHNFLGLYEQDGGILWRHYDASQHQTFGRRGRQLVLTHINSASNADFAYYWIFNQDGSIQVEAKVTGQMRFKQTGKTAVGQNLYAPNQSHHFNYRLDFDVDGAPNKVMQHDFIQDKQTTWHLEESELFCGFSDQNFATNRYWVVKNVLDENKTCHGQNPGYALIPLSKSPAFINESAPILARASFLKHALFVTPYTEDSLNVLGAYPCEASSDFAPSDLPANRGLSWLMNQCKGHPANAIGDDVVLWYTMGCNQLPHSEQSPMMLADTVSFVIKPFGFFNENPALDVDENKFIVMP